MLKQELGQFNTVKQTWMVEPVVAFLETISTKIAVDPFAGRGDLLNAVSEYSSNQIGYDIDEQFDYECKDSLKHIEYIKNAYVITNPPWFAKNTAKRTNSSQYIYFKQNPKYDDLYKIALYKILEKYDYALIIIPETFITSTMNGLLSRAKFVVILEDNPFVDTEHPACVVGFGPEKYNTLVYKDNNVVGYLSDLKQKHMHFIYQTDRSLRFNDQTGTILLKGVDGVKTNDGIRFCVFTKENPYWDKLIIKNTTRHITLVSGDFKKKEREIVKVANRLLESYFDLTDGIFLSAFKGNNVEGRRRRRLDYKLAKSILSEAVRCVS